MSKEYTLKVGDTIKCHKYGELQALRYALENEGYIVRRDKLMLVIEGETKNE